MKAAPRKPSALELFLQAYAGEQTVPALLAAYNEHAAANGHVVVSERVLENILTSSLRMEVAAGGAYRQRAVRTVEAPIARAPAPAAAAVVPAAAVSKAAAAAPAPTPAREAAAAAAPAAGAPSPAAVGTPTLAPTPAALPGATACARTSSAAQSGAPMHAPAAADSADLHDDRLRVADVAADWLGSSPQNSAAQPSELPTRASLVGEPDADAGSCGGNGSRAPDADADCFVTGSKRERVALPHARYDCTEFLLHDHSSDAEARRHCEQCWCAVCQVSAVQCLDWDRHCRTSASQGEALAASARAAALHSRLRSVPRVASPPAAGSPAAALLLDYRWLQLRSDALRYLNNLGNDEDGLTATLVGVHEVGFPPRAGANPQMTGSSWLARRLIGMAGRAHSGPCLP